MRAKQIQEMSDRCSGARESGGALGIASVWKLHELHGCNFRNVPVLKRLVVGGCSTEPDIAHSEERVNGLPSVSAAKEFSNPRSEIFKRCVHFRLYARVLTCTPLW